MIAVVALLTMTLAAPAIGDPAYTDSGDGVSDGSGFEVPFGVGLGGAPNSGDGIPDGSGF